MQLLILLTACSPLAVVASELTLGATAYEGRDGRAVKQMVKQAPRRQLVARRPRRSKQSNK